MKPYTLLSIIFICVVAQHNLSASIITVQRGDSITYTYIHSKDSSSCGLSSYRTSVNLLGEKVYSSIWILSRSKINDSTLQISFKIPNTLIDNQVLSFVAYGYGTCDTITIDTAMIVSGGPYSEGFYSSSIDTFRRGETKSITIEVKGYNIKGKIGETISLENGTNWMDPYIVLFSGVKGINDSQLVGNITIPKHIPDGLYYTNIELNPSEPGPKPFSFASIIIYGGKDIPYVDSVSPYIIGRGEEKEIKIHAIGTQFLYEKPYLLFGNKEVENIVVENDTTIKFKAKVSTGTMDCFNSITLGSYTDGKLFLDSAIEIIGGKPLAKIKLDKEYVVKSGEAARVLIKGENTHFDLGTFTLDFFNSYPITIEKIEVIDSVTIYVNIIGYEYGYYNFRYIDKDIFDGITVENAIVVMPNEKQGYISKMEPPYLHFNSARNYIFTIKNEKLTLLKDKNSWHIGAYTVKNGQIIDIVGFSILNDSMIYVSILLDKFVTDSICAIQFRYNGTNSYFFTFTSLIIVNTNIKERVNGVDNQFRLYPNPVSDKLYIETIQSIKSFTIIDIKGKQMGIDKNDIEQFDNQYSIPTGKIGLQKGIYFIRLESDSGYEYQKFIIE